ncbi:MULTISPECIES: amino acid ABC transporter permease [unclassified Azospirillum]|uniref:amino acid ABC transporter permease n=1 Tax=unclassified Azospirillum TaxID=2630922 RepID=UPI000B71A52D|nr:MULTISPECIES: amino acid ABC transporter permease [unclassified Azospirillum]SNS79529.1 amino acid ABC transporter membrane protein, PAAT family [Azospirillum sp. RU38E]SNS96826.1 amino acid ABC transporter membrane protein, PAAT family [Azospirillum sp. RU37A]
MRRPAPALPLAVLLLLTGCSAEGWHIVNPADPEGWANLRFLLEGAWLTLALSAMALLSGVAIGLGTAALRLSRHRPMRALAETYVELMRTLPLFVLLLWVFYALPIMVQGLDREGWGFALLGRIADLTPFTAAVMALALNAGAFLSEIFRAGIEGVPRGQVEAAQSLGMGRWLTLRRIILPQALRRMLPPTVSQFIHTVKDSSLASSIGLAELTRRATELQTQTYRPLELYTLLALEYLVILLLLSRLARWLERRWGAPP